MQKIYDCDDSDLHIRDNEVIKIETPVDNDEYNGDNDLEYSNEDVKEIKDEANEIFVNEFNDFESDDDKTLSVLSSQVYHDEPKKKVKLKKRKGKVKKIKVKSIKKSEPVKRKDEDDNPETTMDKYVKFTALFIGCGFDSRSGQMFCDRFFCI